MIVASWNHNHCSKHKLLPFNCALLHNLLEILNDKKSYAAWHSSLDIPGFAPKTLEELNIYLVDKLDKEKQILIEQQNKENEFAEKVKQEADREKAEKIRCEIEMKYRDSKMIKAIFFGILGVLLYVLAVAAYSGLRDWLGCVLSLIFAITSTYFYLYFCRQGEYAFEQKIKEYKENNPDNPCIAYLW